MTELRIDTERISPLNYFSKIADSQIEVGSAELDKYQCLIDASNWYMLKQEPIQKLMKGNFPVPLSKSKKAQLSKLNTCDTIEDLEDEDLEDLSPEINQPKDPA